MIEYYTQLSQEEQDAITEVIQLLYRQTFLLEKKYDKRTGRFQRVDEYKVCEKHLDFLKMYFDIAGITLKDNKNMGLIYIQDEMLWGEKLPRLATIYLLILKLLYDEKMEVASSSTQIVTTLGEINGKAGSFRVLSGIPSPTEMRRTIALLKRYQIVEPLDILEELNEETRMVIYPCIHAVLLGDHIKELLMTFSEEEEIGEETTVQGVIENMPE